MKVLATSAAAERDTSLVRVGEIADVESVEGLRIQLGEDNTPKIEYLVKWKVCCTVVLQNSKFLGALANFRSPSRSAVSVLHL